MVLSSQVFIGSWFCISKQQLFTPTAAISTIAAAAEEEEEEEEEEMWLIIVDSSRFQFL